MATHRRAAGLVALARRHTVAARSQFLKLRHYPILRLVAVMLGRPRVGQTCGAVHVSDAGHIPADGCRGFDLRHGVYERRHRHRGGGQERDAGALAPRPEHALVGPHRPRRVRGEGAARRLYSSKFCRSSVEGSVLAGTVAGGAAMDAPSWGQEGALCPTIRPPARSGSRSCLRACSGRQGACCGRGAGLAILPVLAPKRGRARIRSA